MSFVRFVTAVALLGLAACSDKSPGEELFEDLDPPTPNKLRGVYTSTVDEASVTTEIRLRFDEGTVIGGARCTKKDGPTVTVSGEAPLTTNGLETAQGKLTVGALDMAHPTELWCQAGLREGTYDFTVEEDRLELKPENVTTVTLLYRKIGD